MASRSDVNQLRTANDGIVRLATRDLTKFWGSLNLAKPDAARDALLEFIPTLVTEYGDIAATVAADWYDNLRVAAGIRGTFAAVLADGVPDAAVTSTVRFGAGHLFTDVPSGTLDFLSGAVSKYVLQPGRDTIVGSARADPSAHGWYRISGGGCSFCEMLAGRGAVYREDSADFAAHDHCKCGVAPSWDKTRPEADVMQYEASQRTSSMTPEQKANHNESLRFYLASLPD